MMLTPKCFTRHCIHFQGVRQPDGTESSERPVCAAFPNGIPDEIAYGSNLHKTPVPGDRGIRYERDKDA